MNDENKRSDTMSNDTTPNKQQKTEWIQHALIMDGFEELNFPAMTYKKKVGPETYVMINMKDKLEPYFMVVGTRIDDDDATGTLEEVATLISDAMTGVLPTKKDSEEVITISQITGDNEAPIEKPTNKVPMPTNSIVNSENTGSNSQKPVKTDISDTVTTQNDVSTEPPVVTETTQANAPTENNLLDLIQQYVGNDVLQVFGETGSCKSQFCLKVAREAIAAGKKVYYLDTERNLTNADIASLEGCEYKYTPVLDEIDKIVQSLPAVDVVILDSIGFPVLTTYARLSMKQKGDALLTLIAIFGDLKTWAYKHNGVAIVTNQPESEFNKPQGHIFRPFGDKSQFAAKEIWKTKIETRSSKETNISISAFRSRSVGFGTKIASMKISDAGMVIIRK